MKFNLSRVPKHYSFEYTPRFYDPEEEEKQKRQGVDYSEGDAAAKLKEQIRFGMKRQKASGYAFRTQRSAANSAANKRLVSIIIFMCFIGYLMWNSDKIERMLGAWAALAG